MAGVQPGRGRTPAQITALDQPSFSTTSPQSDSPSPGTNYVNTHPRDLTNTRGRGLVAANAAGSTFQTQQGAQASSARSQSTTPGSITRPSAGMNGGLERRPSATYGHYRQTSNLTGVTQHSRNASFVTSPASSPLSPKTIASVATSSGSGHETPSLTMSHIDSSDRRPSDSPASATSASLHTYSSTATLIGDPEFVETTNAALIQRNADRTHSVRARREHSHHRGHSKHHHPQELKTVGEFALHHLFNSFVGQADHKINQCAKAVPISHSHVEDVCGPGVDANFDQLISALGHIARQRPKPLIDTIMYWRKAKSEAVITAKMELNHSRSTDSANRALPRRNTEPLHILYSDSGPLTSSIDETGYHTLDPLQGAVFQAERRSHVSIYLLCRVLTEIWSQSDMASITPAMADRLEEIIFGRLKDADYDQLASSPFSFANWNIYCQLLGVMSDINFHGVSQRFISDLRSSQKEVSVKGAVTREGEGKVELVILAMRDLRVKVDSETAWREACDFLCLLANFFTSVHGQRVKHAYCQVFEKLTLPVAATYTASLSTLKWKDFLSAVNHKLTQMIVKPRHWQEAFPLYAVLLCTSSTDVFLSQWLSVVTSLQSKLKDRMTRGPALQAICRLVWTYINRTVEPISSVTKKLEDVTKIVLPSGKKTYFTTEAASAEPIVELIRIIGFYYRDFCIRNIIFPLLNSEIISLGRDIKVEQLEPEKIVIGIRGFLAIVTDLEQGGYGRPPFPFFGNGVSSEKLPGPPQSPSSAPTSQVGNIANAKEGQLSRPVKASNLDDGAREYYSRFCEILGRLTLICDNTFGGQAVLDEKFSGQTPKTPIAETFSFSRKEEHAQGPDHKQAYYELLHVAIQALPRCLSVHIPLNSLINLLCTGTAHVQRNIATSSVNSLKSIARQSHAQAVTIGFARFIFEFDMRYSTMSDEGMLGPGHIENTLWLYVELLQIWIEEIKQKTKDAAVEPADDGSPSSRGLQLDLTSSSALVDEVESHGFFFLCSQSRRVRSFAVTVLRLVVESDRALGRENPRIIQILEGDSQRVMDSNDEQLSVAERSRLQKGKRKSASPNTLIELCSSDVSYDSTLWFKIFPNLIRLSFDVCPVAVTLGREIVCNRLLQMHKSISTLSENARAPQIPAFDLAPTRALTRLGATPPDVIIEQWKLYLIMACTTLTNAGAQTQSQLANTQHARKISKSAQQGQEKISSARALFAYIIPLLSAGPSSIRDAIVIALGAININLYRTLLDSLQYAVTTCNEEAKLRIGTHQRTASSPRRNRRTDRLRTEVTHVYKLTSHFLHQKEVLQDEWILNNLVTYTKDLRIFLSDAEVQNDWEFQKLRRHYCGLMEEVFEGINRTKDPSRWMPFESRKSAFALMEDWCGYSPNQNQITQREDSMRQSALDQHQDTGEKGNVTAAIEIEKRNLRTAALSAMASLCGGPISITTESKANLYFDIRRMLLWIDQIFGTISDKMHAIGRRALTNLVIYNKDHPYLLEHSIGKCYIAHNPKAPKALESYFEVVTGVLVEHDDYPFAFWRILGAVLFTLGNEKSHIRMKSARLLRILEQRQQKSSKLQDFDISISDKTTAVYKLAQFEISKRLSKQHSESAFFIFSQFSRYFKDNDPDHQRNMVAAILPWIQTIELQLDPNGGPTANSYMLLVNLLEITTKTSSALHNEVQALWQALATGPHGGNVQLILDFVITLCLDRREQSFVDYAKQIVVFLSSTPAGQKVVEFLLLQITPRSMVRGDREPVAPPPDAVGLPYVANLAEALPIGNKQSGFSLGQLSLILLVDLMVAPVELGKESVPLLLQVVIVLWDHYTLLVQEQAREMLVHLIHELVISKIDDDSTSPNKTTIEEFVESIRQHQPKVVWTYEESNGKDEDDEGSRVPASMPHVANEVVSLFTIAYPGIHEQWAKTTLSWATSCPVRHLACRSFQIFRCILTSLDQPMLADMLARLSNTIADEEKDIQTFSMEILTTLKTIIGALEPPDLLQYPQLFWATYACLNTIHEREFTETLGMLEQLLIKVDLSKPAVIKLLRDAKPEKWEGSVEGIASLVYRGLKSATSLEKSLLILDRIAPLSGSELVGDQSRLLFGILANLPRFLHAFDTRIRDSRCIQSAQTLASVAESENHPELSIMLHDFSNARYRVSKDFLVPMLSTLRRSFFPTWEVKSLIFLMGLLTNRLSWYKLKIMEILCVLIPDIDMRQPEITSHGPDLISPLLRLLQTEYCPQALKVLDHIMMMSATPMDKHHLRMSMASSGSRSIRKEYERTQSLYGIPEDTGWSIPTPAIHSNTTRTNVHAVFYTCASANPSHDSPVATPDVEFHTEEFQNSSYFPFDRTATMMSEAEVNLDGNMGELFSKLDSLDDFFEDSLTIDANPSSLYSGPTGLEFGPPNPDAGADLYDQQTAPILHRSLARTASVTSLHSGFTDHRSPSARDPGVMTPVAFAAITATTTTTTTTIASAPLVFRPSLHSRSVTTPVNALPKLRAGADLLSDDETDEIFSDDERSTGNNVTLTAGSGHHLLGSMLRGTRSSMRKFTPGAAGREYRQRAQTQKRAAAQAPISPEVPKVPEAYLNMPPQV